MKIPKLLNLSLVALVSWFALAGVTLAVPITFTFTGTGSGTLNAVPFTNATYTITLKGDTTAITNPALLLFRLNTTATMDIANVGTAIVTEGVGIFDNQEFGAVGFQRQSGSDLLDCLNAAFTTYALATSLGPIVDPYSGPLSQFTNLASTLGPITLSSTGPVTFKAVLGSPPTTWTGDVSIPFQITSLSVDSSGNTKLQKSSSTFTGTMEMYISDMEPQRSTEGCYVKLEGVDGSKICVDQITNISTDIQKSKSEQGLLVGTGTMTMMFGGALSSGIAYLDVKETLKNDSSGEVTAITLSGKIAGGTNDIFVLTGTVKSTLTQ